MQAFLSRQFRALAPIFHPPFDGLWLVVLFYFAWCFLVHPDSPILRGNLPDPDDYMYLDQVLDWIKGQGWFDSIQHRLDPPGGGPIHFSRLPQIPMAALVMFFELFGLPARGAATLMAIIEPLLLLAGFFFVIRWVAESFMPPRWAGATAYVTLFTTGLLEMFVPGHVDHHGLVVILSAAAFGFAIRMMQEPGKLLWGLAAGFMLALSLTVALEVLPWVIVMSAWIGLWGMIEGGKPAKAGLVFGLGLYIASAGFLLISRPPSVLLVPDTVVYSIVYVFFTGSIAAVFAGIALAARMHMAWRWMLGIGIAGVTGVMFLTRFPDLATGPWGGVNPALAKLILDNVTEAAPMVSRHNLLNAVIVVLGPLIAFSANLYFLKTAKPGERWPWSLLAVLLAAALLLSAFYQIRFVGMLGLFMIVPLAALLQRGWRWVGSHWQGRRKVLAEIGLLLLVGPLPGVLIPALADGRSLNVGVLMFPAHSGGTAGICDMYGLERVLRAPELYGGKPRVIMNTMGLGPELLFRTPDLVMSAPYHEDVSGNLDAVRFFSTSDPARAEAIARRRHVDLVVACVLIPGMYSNVAAIREALPDTADRGKKSPGAKPSPPFILQLIGGRQLPPWLKRVQSPILHNYVVYQVALPARAEKPSKAD